MARKQIDPYVTYQKKYQEAAEHQKTKWGLSMVEPMMSRKAFELSYGHQWEKDVKKKGKADKLQIITGMVRDQTYDIPDKGDDNTIKNSEANKVWRRLNQMKAEGGTVAELYKISGYNYQKFRASYRARDFAYQSWYNAISDYYKEGKAQGRDVAELAHAIGVEFYGSPE